MKLSARAAHQGPGARIFANKPRQCRRTARETRPTEADIGSEFPLNLESEAQTQARSIYEAMPSRWVGFNLSYPGSTGLDSPEFSAE